MSPAIAEQRARLLDPDADAAQRSYASLNQLVGLLTLVDGLGLLAFIGTIIMWRVKADESPFLDDHGREATNAQISWFLLLMGGGVVFGLFVLVTIGIGVIALPFFLLYVLFLLVLRVVTVIRAAIAAHRGEYYRYPMTIRFIASPLDA